MIQQVIVVRTDVKRIMCSIMRLFSARELSRRVQILWISFMIIRQGSVTRVLRGIYWIRRPYCVKRRSSPVLQDSFTTTPQGYASTANRAKPTTTSPNSANTWTPPAPGECTSTSTWASASTVLRGTFMTRVSWIAGTIAQWIKCLTMVISCVCWYRRRVMSISIMMHFSASVC